MKIATINFSEKDRKHNDYGSISEWQPDEGRIAVTVLLNGYYYNETGDWLALPTY